MSKTAKKKVAPAKEKRWAPTAEQCAYAICRSIELDVPLEVWDPAGGEMNGKPVGLFRPMTQGEITKGNRYLARTVKRVEYHDEMVARADKERERKEREAEHKAHLERIIADARKLASARAAMTTMPAPKGV